MGSDEPIFILKRAYSDNQNGSFSGANDTTEIGTVPSARDFKKNRSQDLDKTRIKKFQSQKRRIAKPVRSKSAQIFRRICHYCLKSSLLLRSFYLLFNILLHFSNKQ